MGRMQYPVNDDCIFCKIIRGDIPCAKVYEDEHTLAFLDVSPVAPGHTLVVPKGHYPTLLDLPDETGLPLLHAVRLAARAVQEETGAGGFNCLQNNFAPAGQVVFHSHLHIIPRFAGDGLPAWHGGQYPDMDTMRRLAAALSSRITEYTK